MSLISGTMGVVRILCLVSSSLRVMIVSNPQQHKEKLCGDRQSPHKFLTPAQSIRV